MEIQKKLTGSRRGERGAVLFLAIASLCMIIPMVGIAVDVGYLYACKARLQAAVDGAALAAARALHLGLTADDQEDSADQNAVNWFYANFPSDNWGTTNAVMNAGTVEVFDDTDPGHSELRNIRNVQVTARVDVPTIFMKWFNINSTTISGSGSANRRDVVVMMVLDRSSSMNTTGSCGDLRDAAKLFTGQFAAGRDRIGMISFSDGVGPVYPPSQNFRTVLGYDTGTDDGDGAIDDIVCLGGTGTAGAITMGHNELVKINLPGALNVLLVETDGLPNSLAFNLWDTTVADPNRSPFKNQAPVADGCRDTASKSKGQGGWATTASMRSWNPNKVLGGYLGTFAPGLRGTIYSADPANRANGGDFTAVANPWHSSQNMGINGSGATLSRYASTVTPNCRFTVLDPRDDNATYMYDFRRLPRYDLYSNDLKSATSYLGNVLPTGVVMVDSAYAVTTVSANQKYLRFDRASMTQDQIWQNFHNAAINATDDAATRARTNGTIPATVFTVLLGANATGLNTPDYRLMQRIANDPKGDPHGTYPAITLPAPFANQPGGTLVYSSNAAELRQAFGTLANQILRLSQ